MNTRASKNGMKMSKSGMKASKNSVKVSKRLEQIARAAGTAKLLADVGCDHGYTALWALQEGKAEHALCMDINPGPLSIAAANMQKTGFSDRVSFLLSDGLRAAALPEEMLFAGEREKRDAFFRKIEENRITEIKITGTKAAELETVGIKAAGQSPGLRPNEIGFSGLCPDVIVISGMGGQLITEILSLLPTNGAVCTEEMKQALLFAARDYLSGVHRLILSPQSEPECVRAFLWEKLGFHIEEENMLYDEGKYYLILTAVPGREERYDPKDRQSAVHLRYGFRLFEKRDPVFHHYLEEEQRKRNSILQTVSDSRRRAELTGEISGIEIFLKHWEEE